MLAHFTLALGLAAACTACDTSPQRVAVVGAATLSATEPDTGDAARVRRVWARAGDYATPSPDGRYITFVDWSTGDVAMHDIVTGEDRRLTDKGTWPENGSWAEEPLFSPDGSMVAYSYGNVLGADPFRYELRVVAVDDTTQRLLHALTARDYWILPMDWSASQGILVKFYRDADGKVVTDLAVVDPASGAVRVLRTYAEGRAHPHDGAFSPDGRFIAYRLDKDVRIMTADAARDASLDMEVRWVLGWTPDGRSVLVHASAHSTTGIWSIPVTDGRRAGQPALVRGGMAAFLPGGRAGDRYYYGVPVDAPKIHTVSVDIPSARVLSPPTPLTSPLDGAAHVAAWSPDGGGLAYVLRDLAGRGTRIMLRAADGDEVRELATVGRLQVHQVLWTPDGQALLLNTTGTGEPVLRRVDIRTGSVRPVLEPSGQGVATTPDGRVVYVRDVPNRPELVSGVFVHDLTTGRERRIADVPDETRKLSVSPDGRRIALVTGGDESQASRLLVLRIEGGEAREVWRAEYPLHLERNASRPPWTPDGRYVLVVRGSWEDGEHVVLAVPVDGGEPITVMDFPDARPHLSLHPDGRRLAYSAGERRTELWVLDDLTPEQP